MKWKDILDFVKIEHTLFSLPFVLMGFILAKKQLGEEILEVSLSNLDLLWIILAAIGARGLAMALNRLIDKEIDAKNPRTASRHLPSGKMTEFEAWSLSIAFLATLLFASWRLNMVALKMAWLPVIAFVIYPYTKRFSWICHFWIGLCLALAPAGAWVAISADTMGWESIIGVGSETWIGREFAWFPELFFISMGVALWITAFDVNYARMDVEVDQRQGIRSFPATFGLKTTKGLSIALTLGWSICFLFAGLSDYTDLRDYRYPLWIPSVILMATVNLYVMTSHASKSESSSLDMEKFQQLLFKTSMLTGWVLLASLSFTEGMID